MGSLNMVVAGVICLTVLLPGTTFAAPEKEKTMELIEARKIWDKATTMPLPI